MLAKPLVSDRDKLATERRAFPSEVSYTVLMAACSSRQARERLTTYRSRLSVSIKYRIYDDAGDYEEFDEIRDCGMLPVMVRVS